MRICALLTAFLLTVGPNTLKFNFLGPQSAYWCLAPYFNHCQLCRIRYKKWPSL